MPIAALSPELAYKSTTAPTERRRIQAAVVEAHRGHVARLVRSMVSGLHCDEAEQVGAIGVLVALEKYDPTPRPGFSSPPAFWAYSHAYVRDEIRAWMANGVYWRKPANRGKSPARKAQRDAARRQMVHGSLDEPLHADADATLYDLLVRAEATVEELVADAEVKGRLLAFAATLSAADLKILFSEHSQCVRSRHHLSLVERAAAYVRGKNDDGHSRPSHRDTAAATGAKP